LPVLELMHERGSGEVVILRTLRDLRPCDSYARRLSRLPALMKHGLDYVHDETLFRPWEALNPLHLLLQFGRGTSFVRGRLLTHQFLD